MISGYAILQLPPYARHLLTLMPLIIFVTRLRKRAFDIFADYFVAAAAAITLCSERIWGRYA